VRSPAERHPTPVRYLRSRRRRGRLGSAASALVVGALVSFPIYWMIVTAISPEQEMYSAHPPLVPHTVLTGAFAALLRGGEAGRWLVNSAVVSLGAVIATLASAILSGYAISRFRFRGATLFSALLLATQMLPQALIIVPIYIIFRWLHLLNSLFGLIVINLAINVPVATWILKGYFDTVPREIEEAALIDGCTRLQALRKVVLPSAMPAVIAVGVIVLIEAWNEYLFATTLITSQSRWVTSVGLASFLGMFTIPIEQVMAGALLFTLPVVVCYFALQRHLVSGITGGAVKG
jgi:multiple sugar transport system permease protein